MVTSQLPIALGYLAPPNREPRKGPFCLFARVDCTHVTHCLRQLAALADLFDYLAIPLRRKSRRLANGIEGSVREDSGRYSVHARFGSTRPGVSNGSRTVSGWMVPALEYGSRLAAAFQHCLNW